MGLTRAEFRKLLLIASACGGRFIGQGSVLFGSAMYAFDGNDIRCARGFKEVAFSMGYRVTEVKRQDGIVGIGHRDYVEVKRDALTENRAE